MNKNHTHTCRISLHRHVPSYLGSHDYTIMPPPYPAFFCSSRLGLRLLLINRGRHIDIITGDQKFQLKYGHVPKFLFIKLHLDDHLLKRPRYSEKGGDMTRTRKHAHALVRIRTHHGGMHMINHYRTCTGREYPG